MCQIFKGASQQERVEETKRNIREAVELHLEAMGEVGEPIPAPTSTVDSLELNTVV
jgi:predicted RNase H-like HicB family nuclease